MMINIMIIFKEHKQHWQLSHIIFKENKLLMRTNVFITRMISETPALADSCSTHVWDWQGVPDRGRVLMSLSLGSTGIPGALSHITDSTRENESLMNLLPKTPCRMNTFMLHRSRISENILFSMGLHWENYSMLKYSCYIGTLFLIYFFCHIPHHVFSGRILFKFTLVLKTRQISMKFLCVLIV